MRPSEIQSFNEYWPRCRSELEVMSGVVWVVWLFPERGRKATLTGWSLSIGYHLKRTSA
jgi:hypothetical protein